MFGLGRPAHAHKYYILFWFASSNEVPDVLYIGSFNAFLKTVCWRVLKYEYSRLVSVNKGVNVEYV